MTQKEFARKIRVSPGHLNSVIKGRCDSEVTRFKIAQALGKKTRDLFPDAE